MSRVIDGVAAASDWSALDAAATRDPGLWRAVAVAQHRDAEFRRAVEAMTAPSAGVALPGLGGLDEQRAGPVVGRNQRDGASATLADRLRLAGSYGGWVAAASLLLGVTVFNPSWRSATPFVGNTAGLASPFASASDALEFYLKQGRTERSVLGQVPDKVLLSAQPSADGKGFEVTYLRQILERQRVDSLYRPAVDDAGQIRPLPVRLPASGSSGGPVPASAFNLWSPLDPPGPRRGGALGE